MKKIIAILVAVLSISTAKAQEKKGSFQKMTPEQKTELAVKKMTLKLDLTPNQANQIKPLLLQQTKERKAMHAKRKALKEKGKRPDANERYRIANARLDKKLAFKKEMKTILNEKQYEKFEKIMAHKIRKIENSKKRRKHRKDFKERH